MAKYEITVTEIKEDGSHVPAMCNEEPIVVNCTGFCIIGHTEEEGKPGIGSRVVTHDTDLSNLIVSVKHDPYLSIAAMEVVRGMLSATIGKKLAELNEEDEEDAAE